jgi:hypothetical protein
MARAGPRRGRHNLGSEMDAHRDVRVVQPIRSRLSGCQSSPPQFLPRPRVGFRKVPYVARVARSNFAMSGFASLSNWHIQPARECFTRPSCSIASTTDCLRTNSCWSFSGSRPSSQSTRISSQKPYGFSITPSLFARRRASLPYCRWTARPSLYPTSLARGRCAVERSSEHCKMLARKSCFEHST